VLILLIVARRRLGGGEGSAMAVSLAQTGAAAALMAMSLAAFRALLPDASALVTGAGGLVVGATTYVAAALVLGSEELRQLPGLLLRRAR
jgi:hypothetical protein